MASHVRHVKMTDDAWNRLRQEAARQTIVLGRTVYPAQVLSKLMEKHLPPVTAAPSPKAKVRKSL